MTLGHTETQHHDIMKSRFSIMEGGVDGCPPREKEERDNGRKSSEKEKKGKKKRRSKSTNLKILGFFYASLAYKNVAASGGLPQILTKRLHPWQLQEASPDPHQEASPLDIHFPSPS